MDWKESNDKKLIKEVTPDNNLVSSLFESSNKKFETASRLELDEITASSKITLYYDCLREILEAISIKKGFKIYNHECYCAFLKEILKEEEIGDLFDRFRKIRNDINIFNKIILYMAKIKR